MKLSIPDMSCGHCKAVVEKAINGQDPAAKIRVDLETHEVEVDTKVAPAPIIAALSEEGYPAVLLG
jgi:copper chaperone